MGVFSVKVDRKDFSVELGRLRSRGREVFLEFVGSVLFLFCFRICFGIVFTVVIKELARFWRVMTLRERRSYW